VKLVIAVAVIAGCDRRAPIATCKQNLSGTYLADGKRWMLEDHGDTLEAWPLFPDIPANGELEIAPRVIDFVRNDEGVSGNVRRRYMRGREQCNAKIPARITVCADDALDVVLADPVPPLQFEGPIQIGPALDDAEDPDPIAKRRVELYAVAFTWQLCVYPRADSSRRERWLRE
jgi:hypothetical protein